MSDAQANAPLPVAAPADDPTEGGAKPLGRSQKLGIQGFLILSAIEVVPTLVAFVKALLAGDTTTMLALLDKLHAFGAGSGLYYMAILLGFGAAVKGIASIAEAVAAKART